jgi:hypothetical protein
VYNKTECQINQHDLLGTAQDLGFSSASHLHYTVYINRNDDGDFDDDETIDPLISVHMLR